MRHQWTDYEIDILAKNYPKYGADQSQWDIRIKRSRDAIIKKAHKMGIVCITRKTSLLNAKDRQNLKIIIKRLSEKLEISEKDLIKEMIMLDVK